MDLRDGFYNTDPCRRNFMKIENWFSYEEEKPEQSGDYLIRIQNKKAEPSFYLKKGESILLRSTPPDPSQPENRLLFALSRHMVEVKITQTGFYFCEEKEDGKELIRKIPEKDLYWSSAPNKSLRYAERKRILKQHWREESMSDDVVTKAISDHIRSEEKILFLQKSVEKTFSNEVFSFYGVTYQTNPLYVKRAFLKALNYRRAIRSLINFPKKSYLSALLADSPQNSIPLEDALKLRDEFCKYLSDQGLYFEDVQAISDAYFINLFLPTKKDVIRVLYRDETGKNDYVSKNMFLLKVFQRYMIIDMVRMMGKVFLSGTVRNDRPFDTQAQPTDGLLDNISLTQLAANMAISRFSILAFEETFKKEMGIA